MPSGTPKKRANDIAARACHTKRRMIWKVVTHRRRVHPAGPPAAARWSRSTRRPNAELAQLDPTLPARTATGFGYR
jgi:hypothetical protein